MMNPILEKEIKTRMRTVKTPILLTLYLMMISFIVFIFFITSGGFNPKTAVTVYQVIGMAQYIIILMMVPALTAIAISGERERQTLDLMLCTDISPWKIIFGKIFASLSFIFFLIIATLPFMGIVFLFGGISILEIIGITLYLLASAFMVSSIGLFFSIKFKKNITAIIVTYFVTGLIFVGTIIIFAISMAIISGMIYDYAVIEKILPIVTMICFSGNPLYGFGLMLFDNFNLGYMFSMGGYGNSTLFLNMEPWVVNMIFVAVVSGLMLLFSRMSIGKVK